MNENHSKVSKTKIQVRYVETDKMGFAHHSHYVVWMEAARIDLTKKLGYTYSRLENEGYMMPVLEMNIKYYKPLLFEDTFEIECKLAYLKKLRMNFSYKIFKGEVLTTIGETKHTFINKAGKLVLPPEGFVKAFS